MSPSSTTKDKKLSSKKRIKNEHAKSIKKSKTKTLTSLGKQNREAAANLYKAALAQDKTNDEQELEHSHSNSLIDEDGQQGASDASKEIVPVNNDKKLDDSIQQTPFPQENVQASPFKNLRESLPKDFRVIVFLENACLEAVKVSKDGVYQLMNCDDHKNIMMKHNIDPSTSRPDISHQCLLALMDSPLNKAGLLKVYIRTAKNVLIEIHPQTRIPRTFKRFCGLMVELLQKYKIRGTNSPEPLLKVIRNPIVSHLPVGCIKNVCTFNTERRVDIREHARDCIKKAVEKQLSAVCYVVGAMAHGKVEEDWADDNFSMSNYPLSGAQACFRITNAFENLFNVL